LPLLKFQPTYNVRAVILNNKGGGEGKSLY